MTPGESCAEGRNEAHHDVAGAFDKSFKNLNIDYVDLYVSSSF